MVGVLTGDELEEEEEVPHGEHAVQRVQQRQRLILRRPPQERAQDNRSHHHSHRQSETITHSVWSRACSRTVFSYEKNQSKRPNPAGPTHPAPPTLYLSRLPWPPCPTLTRHPSPPRPAPPAAPIEPVVRRVVRRPEHPDERDVRTSHVQHQLDHVVEQHARSVRHVDEAHREGQRRQVVTRRAGRRRCEPGGTGSQTGSEKIFALRDLSACSFIRNTGRRNNFWYGLFNRSLAVLEIL